MNVRNKRQFKRNHRTRKQKIGSFIVPRLCVYKSMNHIYAQAIDDYHGRTLLSINSLSINERCHFTIGQLFGKMLTRKGFLKLIFDRNGFSYSVNLSKLVNGIRESGINI